MTKRKPTPELSANQSANQHIAKVRSRIHEIFTQPGIETVYRAAMMIAAETNESSETVYARLNRYLRAPGINLKLLQADFDALALAGFPQYRVQIIEEK